MRKILINALKSLVLPVIVYLIFLIPNFKRFGNVNCLYTIFLQSIIPAVLGYGVSLGFICGVFDFTVGSRVIIAALVGGILSVKFGLAGLILGCVVTSIIIGLFTGFVNWAVKIPSIVVTLGLTMIYEIIGQKVTGSASIVRLSKECSILGAPPYNIITLMVTGVLFYIVFYNTKFSYHARMNGSEETLSKNMGVRVQWTKALTFVIGGAFLGVAAILQISASGTISPQVNLASAMLLFKPLMGVLVGLALQPVCNLAVGIFIGGFTVNTIFVGLIASGLPDTFQDVALGIFLLIVMLFSENKDTIAKRFRRKSEIVIDSKGT